MVRRRSLPVPPAAAWSACLALLRSPDPARGVTARRCEPDPPQPGAVVISVAAGRELRATIEELEEGVRLVTVSDVPGSTLVRTTVELEAQGAQTRLRVISEAATPIPVGGAVGALLDRLLLGGSQRRAAAAILRRIAELSLSSSPG